MVRYSKALAVCILSASCGSLLAADVAEKVTYDDQVMPIFREHCLACHDSGGRSGDLALDTYNDTLTGGGSGEVVEPGAGDASRLYRVMAHLEKPQMPPGGDKVPDEQLAVVKAWIDGGLLENFGSKAKKSSKPQVEAFVPSADNRPAGEPAMPHGFYREPVLHAEHTGAVADLSASPWAPLVAITGQRQVLLYHADSRELLAVVPFVVGAPEVVRFSRNGDLLLVAGGRGAKLGVVHLWDINTGQRISEIGDEVDTVLAADLLADHSLVALGGPRKRVQVYRTADNTLAYSITKHTDWVTALEFSPNGEHLVTADRAGNAHVWEAATGRPVTNLTGHKQAITAVSWRGDSGLVATASDDGDIRTWQPGGNQVKQWNHGGGVQDIEFTKQGKLASIGRDRFAKLWDANGKELAKVGPLDDIGLAVTVTHDESQLVTADWTGAVRVASVETQQMVGELPANPPTLAMRLESARTEANQIAEKLPNVEQQMSLASQQVDEAQSAVAEHQASEKQHAERLAQLEQQRAAEQAELADHRQRLEQLDAVLATARNEQETAERELSELKQQLAQVGNQQSDDADATEAGQLEMQIADKQTALEDIVAKRSDAEAKRKPVVEARKTTQEQLDQLATQVKLEREAVDQLNGAKAQLPDMVALTNRRDELAHQLEQLRGTQEHVGAQITSLEAEIAAYAAALPTLERTLAENEQAVGTEGANLSEVKQQLAAEAADVAAVAREIEDLERRVADLMRVRDKLADIAQKSQDAADQIEQQISKLSSDQAKIEKQLSDLHAADELRQQFGRGN